MNLPNSNSTDKLLNFVIKGNTNSDKKIVLIHGLFGSLENLNMVANHFTEDYMVISIDARNHGKSFHHHSMSYKEMANDVIKVLDHLNIQQCFLLGHSMGGKIAMQCALDNQSRIKALIVADIAPVNYPPHHNVIIDGLKSINLSQIGSRRDADEKLSQYVEEPGVRQFLLKNLVKTDLGFVWRVNIDNIANDYNSIAEGFTPPSLYNGPTLFVKGGNSNYITAEHQQIIKQLFPLASAKIIQGAGHWLHAEKTVAFNKIVSNFIGNN